MLIWPLFVTRAEGKAYFLPYSTLPTTPMTDAQFGYERQKDDMRGQQFYSNSDQKKQQVVQIATEVFSAYQRLWPNFMRNKSFPRVEVTKYKVMKGHFATIGETNQGSLIFDGTAPIDHFIIAHEMAHYLLNHRDTFIYIESNGISYKYDDLKDVNKIAEHFISFNTFLYPQFNGYNPIGGGLGELWMKLFQEISNARKCVSEYGALTRIASEISDHFDRTNYSVKFTSEETDSYAKRIPQLIKEIDLCFQSNGLDTTFIEANKTVNSYKNTYSNQMQNMGPIEMLSFVISSYQYAFESRVLNKNLDQPEYFYSTEDQADQFASVVTTFLGSQSSNLENQLTKNIKSSARAWQTCEQILGGKSDPKMGFLVSPYHNDCYRLVMIQRYRANGASALGLN